jgi:predicted Fe-Mo cluster-binding NifX family protein
MYKHVTRKILFSLLLAVSVITGAQAEGVFAIAADGDKLSSEIVKLAGIAPYFHIYDSDGGLMRVLPNPHLKLEFGTGPAAAASLADMGVTVLVARKVPGPKMEKVLVERNVRIVRRIGTVDDVVKELRGE